MKSAMDFDLKGDNNMKTILSELKEIEAKVSALINRLESENTSITTTVGEVRKIAILEEIYRKGGTVTPKEISNLQENTGKVLVRQQAIIREISHHWQPRQIDKQEY